jgi:hypothetical protein
MRLAGKFYIRTHSAVRGVGTKITPQNVDFSEIKTCRDDTACNSAAKRSIAESPVIGQSENRFVRQIRFCAIHFLMRRNGGLTQAAHQPRFCEAPVALDGFGRDSQDRGCFLDAEAAEESKFDHSNFTRINFP